jgi:Mor family transcriptional regulator
MQEQQLDIIGAIVSEMRAALGEGVAPDSKWKDVEARLRQAWGGQAVYAKKTDIDIEARAKAIRDRYNTRNRLALQEEFSISKAQFYRILKGA